MTEVEVLKSEAMASERKASWRETGERLIHCQMNDDGSFTFRNTTEATRRGPVISEAQAEKFLTN